MAQALLFAVIASGALVLGSVAGVYLRLPRRVLALMLAFRRRDRRQVALRAGE